MRVNRIFLLATLAVTVSSCATPSYFGYDRATLQLPASDPEQWSEPGYDNQQPESSENTTRPRQGRLDTRTIPALRDPRSSDEALPDSRPILDGNSVNITLPSQSITSFINTVFGEVLEVPFSLGPDVSTRSEIITLRTVRDMPPETFLILVEEALKDYGIAVIYDNGLYRIIAMDELRAQVPQFIRSRSRPNVPEALQPVVQFVELTAIDSADMETILNQAFPDRERLHIRTNRGANSLVLSGMSRDVNSALSIIAQMDELRFANTRVVTITPQNWQASQLAQDMRSILETEGYFVAIGSNQPRAITLLPLSHVNQLLIFARDRQLSDYVVALAQRLDREAYVADARVARIYNVQHTDATELASIVSAATGNRYNARSEDNAATQTASAPSTNLTVDPIGNRIIFFGTQREYEQVARLMSELDTPIPEVLIEVTIAEVTLTDNMNYGLDAVFDSETASGFAARLTSNDGFSAVVQSGQVNLSASANAGNNQINILSTPRVIARSGSEGFVQVGTDVPVITTQRAAETQSGGSSDVLQTVEYRSTGVIMSVTPTVYSGNRIDLQINQEVSSAEANNNSAIASPIISNRRMTSELSLQDGQTAVLGGLIESRFTRGNTGIPFLKDVPIVGAPFRGETFNSTRTMLVILVTPYILDTRRDRQAVVNSLVDAINDGYRNQTVANPTLTPPTEPMRIRPRAAADSE